MKREVRIYFQGEWVELLVNEEFWKKVGPTLSQLGSDSPIQLLKHLLELEEKLFQIEKKSQELVEKIAKFQLD